ncbi:HAD family hydrolase [Chloroflexota bacterium]
MKIAPLPFIGKRKDTPESIIAAFFDVDGTLLKENTSILFLKHFYKDKKIRTEFLLRAIYYNFLHKINCLSFEELSHFSLGFMKDQDIKELKNNIKYYFEKDIKYKISKKMISIIRKHRGENHLIVLLTSSPSIIIENFKNYLNADYAITSLIETKDGKLTGKFKAICYKDKKYELFKAFSKRKNTNLKESYFYTDSCSDLKVLESVGYPIAVNPKRNLKKIAINKKWKIIELGD